MHPCRRALAPLALIALLAGCANAPTAPASAGAGTSPTAAAPEEHPEQTLTKGMTADQVRQIMGKPAEIAPQPSPTGKAEVWTYYRTTVGPSTQLQVGVKPITITVRDPDGVNRTQTLAEDPIYRLAHIRTTETIRLLMFDGWFAEKAVTAQRQQEFE